MFFPVLSSLSSLYLYGSCGSFLEICPHHHYNHHAPIMAPLNILSLKVQGFNTPHKCTKALRSFTSAKAHIISLQEPFFTNKFTPKFLSASLPSILHSFCHNQIMGDSYWFSLLHAIHPHIPNQRPWARLTGSRLCHTMLQINTQLLFSRISFKWLEWLYLAEIQTKSSSPSWISPHQPHPLVQIDISTPTYQTQIGWFLVQSHPC